VSEALLELHSDDLRVLIAPRIGARIVSICDRDGNEYVEAGLPPVESLTAAHSYLDGGLGGIDDCFPGITAELLTSPARTVPDHGEVWCRPVTVLAAGAQRIVTTQSGIRGDFELSRVFELRGGSLRVAYELRNLTETSFEALWAAHPLFVLTPDTELELDQLAHFRIESGTMELGEFDLVRPGTVPDGNCLKAFAPLPPGTTLGVLYPGRGKRVSMRLEADRPAWLGLWLNAGGFPEDSPVRHLALEPSFGDCDSLSQAIANGTCLRLAPEAAATWSLEYGVDRGAS
jgi:galactose mutarotase-like enzyme